MSVLSRNAVVASFQAGAIAVAVLGVAVPGTLGQSIEIHTAQNTYFANSTELEISWTKHCNCTGGTNRPVEFVINGGAFVRAAGPSLGGCGATFVSRMTTTPSELFREPYTCLTSIQIRNEIPTPNSNGSCGSTGGVVVTSNVLNVWLENIVTNGPNGVNDFDGTQAACTGSPSGCNRTTVGRPVDVVTGNMYHEMVDLRIQAPLPIQISRRYDSQSGFDGALGYGWQHNYMQRLEFVGAIRVELIDRESRRVGFACSQFAAGDCLAWSPNNVDNLTLTEGTNPPWRVTDKHQTKYDFDTSGRLTRIEDRNNNAIDLGYTGADLTTITDPESGRAVALTYDGSTNRLEALSAAGRTVTYTYDASTSNLERVDWSDGSFVTYEYNDPFDPHNMTAARDSYGHLIEGHEYYPDSRDRVMRTQSDGGNYEYTLQYDTPLAGQTTVTNSRVPPVESVFAYDPLTGVVKSSSGPGCASCGGGGTTTALEHDDFLNVTRITDAEGGVTELSYDENDNGNVMSRTEAYGTPEARTTAYTWHPTYNLIETETVPTLGNCSDPQQQPVENRVTTYTYEPDGDRESEVITGCAGNQYFSRTTSYTYDDHGQIKTVDGPLTVTPNDLTTFQYYPDGGDPTLSGRLEKVTNALGHETIYADYDFFGNVGSVTDPNDVETTYLYDAKDRVTETRIVGPTQADDIVTEQHWDLEGNLDYVKSPNCVADTGCAYTEDYTYDAVNRLTEVIDPAGNKIVYSYDTEGNRIREQYREGPPSNILRAFTNFSYDDFNRLEYIYFTDDAPEDPNSVFFKYTYSGDGLRQSERDPEGHITSFDYDELKRLTTVTQTIGPDTASVIYDHDLHDNLSSVTDQNGLVTSFTNHDMGWQLSVDSPDTGLTAYVHDEAGNVTTVTDANANVTTRAYDALNRSTSVTYPDSSLNVVFTYDIERFGIGRRAGMQDDSGMTTYYYDRRGLLTQEDRDLGPETWFTRYQYDKTGNRTHVFYPSNDSATRQGEVVYSYDAANRVSGITAMINGSTTSVANSFAYEPFGPRKQLVFGNNLVDTRTFKTRYELDDWTVGNILDYEHVFDNDLNLITRTDNKNTANNRTYEYDETHRLTLAAGPWGSGTACPGSTTYTYDLNGNRECKGEQSPATTYTYAAGTNILDSATTGSTSTEYDFDANGNITLIGSRDFEYDSANRLASVDGGDAALYVYDGDGRRVVKIANDITTYFFYDASHRLLSEIRLHPLTGKDYINLEIEPVGRVDWTTEQYLGDEEAGDDYLRLERNEPNVRLDWTGFTGDEHTYVIRRKQVVDPNDKTFNGSVVLGTVNDPMQTYDDPVLNDGNDYDYRVFVNEVVDSLYFYHSDVLDTPIAITNDDNPPTVVWRAEHYPFGEIIGLPTEGIENNLRFPGQFADVATPIYYNLNRWYEPSSGRYTQADPLGLVGGPNLYGYAFNNPVVFVDPLGLLVEFRCRTVGPLGGADDFRTWTARNIFGAKHCFLDVSCDSDDISSTTVSYLRGGVEVVQNAGGQLNNDVAYSLAGRYRSFPVKDPIPSCDDCSFEKCVVETARRLSVSDFRMENYWVAGPNSNSFALRLVRECGGKLGVPVSDVGRIGAYGVESPWNIDWPDE